MSGHVGAEEVALCNAFVDAKGKVCEAALVLLTRTHTGKSPQGYRWFRHLSFFTRDLNALLTATLELKEAHENLHRA